MAITATTARSEIVQTPTVAKASEPKAKPTESRPSVGPSVVVSVGRGQAQVSGTYGSNGRLASNETATQSKAPEVKAAPQPAVSAKKPEVKAAPEPAKKAEPTPVAKAPEPAKKPVAKAPEPAKHVEPKPAAKTPEPVVSAKQPQPVTKTVGSPRA